MFYVYLLRSESYEDQRYTGFTNNLKQRFRKHNEDERKAREFEFYLKAGSGKAFANKHFW